MKMNIKSSKEVIKVNEKTDNVYIPTVLNTIHEKGEAQTITENVADEKQNPKTMVSNGKREDEAHESSHVNKNNKEKINTDKISDGLQEQQNLKNSLISRGKKAILQKAVTELENSIDNEADTTQIESDLIKVTRKTYDSIKLVKDISNKKRRNINYYQEPYQSEIESKSKYQYKEYKNKLKIKKIEYEISNENVSHEFVDLKNCLNKKFPPENRKKYDKYLLQAKRNAFGPYKDRNTTLRESAVNTNPSVNGMNNLKETSQGQVESNNELRSAIKNGNNKLEMNIESTEFKANIMTDSTVTYDLKKNDIKTQIQNGISTGTDINRSQVAKDAFKKQAEQYRKEQYKKNFRNQVLKKAKNTAANAQKGAVTNAIKEITKAVADVVGGEVKAVVGIILIVVMLVIVIFLIVTSGVDSSAAVIFGTSSADESTGESFDEEAWLKEKIKKSREELVEEIKDIVDDNKDEYSSIKLVNGLNGSEITIDDNNILNNIYTEEEYYQKIQSIFHVVLLSKYDLEATENERTTLYEEIWDTLTVIETSESVAYTSASNDNETTQQDNNQLMPDTKPEDTESDNNFMPDASLTETTEVSSKSMTITICTKGFSELTKKYFTNRVDELKAKGELTAEEKKELSDLESYYEICLEYFANLGGNEENENTASGTTDFSGVETLSSVPYYCQWNSQWGAVNYGGGTISSSGCGPTCCAMVVSYYTGKYVTPADIVEIIGDTYYVPGAGSSWSLFPGVASMYGVNCSDLGVNITSVVQSLRNGEIVIASVKPGTFTKAGHFIVLTGITEDGKITVNDPNHPDFCRSTFETSIFVAEAKNYWKFSK